MVRRAPDPCPGDCSRSLLLIARHRFQSRILPLDGGPSGLSYLPPAPAGHPSHNGLSLPEKPFYREAVLSATISTGRDPMLRSPSTKSPATRGDEP